VSGEKLEQASDGIEGPDSVEVEHTVGTADEYSVESSPDVAVDGSIKRSDEPEEQQEDRGFIARVIAWLR
jgi:hypothetical protein